LRERFDLRTMLEGIIRPALDAQFLKTVFCDAFVFFRRTSQLFKNLFENKRGRPTTASGARRRCKSSQCHWALLRCCALPAIPNHLTSLNPPIYGQVLKQHEALSPEQKNLALAVHASDLYPSEMEKTSAMAHALGAVFHWQDNSEGPLIVASKVLYLLERYGQDVQWLIHMWTLSDTVTRSSVPPPSATTMHRSGLNVWGIKKRSC
jgi:hypothetical protein